MKLEAEVLVRGCADTPIARMPGHGALPPDPAPVLEVFLAFSSIYPFKPRSGYPLGPPVPAHRNTGSRVARVDAISNKVGRDLLAYFTASRKTPS